MWCGDANRYSPGPSRSMPENIVPWTDTYRFARCSATATSLTSSAEEVMASCLTSDATRMPVVVRWVNTGMRPKRSRAANRLRSASFQMANPKSPFSASSIRGPRRSYAARMRCRTSVASEPATERSEPVSQMRTSPTRVSGPRVAMRQPSFASVRPSPSIATPAVVVRSPAVERWGMAAMAASRAAASLWPSHDTKAAKPPISRR